MKITTVTLENVGLIPLLSIPVNSVVWIQGENGVGKTTIINAIKSVFNGGHHPYLIGPNGSKAVITILLDDGTQIKRTITLKQSTYLVLRPDGSKMDDQADYVKALCSGLTLDPTELVHAEKADRIKFLQRVIDIHFTREEIEQATGGIHPEHQDGMDLKRFEELLQGTIEKRREANGRRDTLEAHRQGLAKDIPQDSDTMNWAASASSIAKKVTGLKVELAKLQQESDAAIKDAIQEAQDERDREVAKLDKKLMVRKDEIRQKAVEILRTESASLNTAITELSAQEATAKERAEKQAQATGLRQSLEKLQADVATASKVATTLDTVIEKLRRLHKKKLEEMPVPGLEVRDGEIFYEGKNYHTQTNTAMQYFVAFKIARAGGKGQGLPFFIFDKAQDFTTSTREEFVAAVKEIGYQVVMASPMDGKPLTVTSA